MPQPAVLPLSDVAFWQDPYPVLRAAREQHRTAVTDSGVPAVLRHADADALLKGDLFINEGVELLEQRGFQPGDPLWEWRRLALGAMNGEAHRRVRALVGKAITAHTVDYLRPAMRRRADALLDAVAAQPVVDAWAAFARPLPLRVVSDFLGIADADRDRVAALVGQGFGDAFGVRVDQAIRDRVNATFRILMDFVRELIEGRRLAPGPDALSALLAVDEGGDRLTDDELVVLFLNLFVGATESTTVVLASGLLELGQHPQQRDWLLAHPQAMSAAVEEIARLRPGNFAIANKVAARDGEACGLAFRCGDRVMIPIGAPNRDPRVWPQPDAFDIRRPLQKHFTFSAGYHFCLGQALARVQLQEALAAWLGRFPAYRIAALPRWRPFTAIHAMEELLIEIL